MDSGQGSNWKPKRKTGKQQSTSRQIWHIENLQTANSKKHMASPYDTGLQRRNWREKKKRRCNWMGHCWELRGVRHSAHNTQIRPRELKTLNAFQWAPPPAAHLGYFGGNYTLRLTQCNHTHHSGCFLMPCHAQSQNTEKM